ncbi:hypothetical protein NKH77_29075 [Streptomyces sp. M19]
MARSCPSCLEFPPRTLNRQAAPRPPPPYARPRPRLRSRPRRSRREHGPFRAYRSPGAPGVRRRGRRRRGRRDGPGRLHERLRRPQAPRAAQRLPQRGGAARPDGAALTSGGQGVAAPSDDAKHGRGTHRAKDAKHRKDAKHPEHREDSGHTSPGVPGRRGRHGARPRRAGSRPR